MPQKERCRCHRWRQSNAIPLLIAVDVTAPQLCRFIAHRSRTERNPDRQLSLFTACKAVHNPYQLCRIAGETPSDEDQLRPLRRRRRRRRPSCVSYWQCGDTQRSPSWPRGICQNFFGNNSARCGHRRGHPLWCASRHRKIDASAQDNSRLIGISVGIDDRVYFCSVRAWAEFLFAATSEKHKTTSGSHSAL